MNVLETLTKRSKELDALVAKNLEASEAGTLSAEDAATAQKAINDYVADAQEVIANAKSADNSRAELAKVRKALVEAGTAPEDNVDKAKASVEGLASKSGVVDPKGMTLGQAIATSEAYKGLEGRRSADGSFAGQIQQRLQVEGSARSKFLRGEDGNYRSKDLSTISDAARGSVELPVDVYHPEPGSDLMLRDVCRYTPVSRGGTFNYVTMTHTNNAAFVAEATSDAAIGGGAGEVTPIVGGRKPQSNVQYDAVEATFRTLAHTLTLHRNQLSDRPQMMAEINAFMIESLPKRENDEILLGTGAPGLDGIMPNANVPTLTPVAGATDLDSILLGVAEIWKQGRRPSTMVINPNDWFTDGFVLAKDGNQNYMFGGPTAGYDALNSLWGMRVLVSQSLAAGSALIGDFKGATFADRQKTTVHITDSNKDHFERNMIDILVEERVGFAVTDPLRFIKVAAV